MLVFDILDDGIPATVHLEPYRQTEVSYHIPSIIVDLVSIPRGIDNVEP